MKRTLLLICTLLCANVLFAQTFWIGDLKYGITSIAPLQVAVSDANESITTANIPTRVMYGGEYYGVTSIGDMAFANCTNLTSVNIPNGVTYIGGSAFADCSSLTSINIPNGVTAIGGDGTFANCTSLTSINIPNSVTSIGGFVFSGCSSLSSVTIGNNVTSIGELAFYGCSSLTSITIPNSVTSIGVAMFSGCSSLSSVTIGNSVTSIGDQAFQNCSSLTSVAIPNSVTSIGERAFKGCSGLTSITIPNSVTSIGAGLFADCSSLTSVTLSNNITELPTVCYSNCFGFFRNCSNLISIDIPNSITSIGDQAFYGCSSLTSITCLAETAPLLGASVFSSTPSNKTLTVPFNASGYTSDWGNGEWQKIYHKINQGETEILSTTFEITDDNKREIINKGVLKIVQGGEIINQTSTNVGGIIEIEATNLPNNWNYIGAPFNNYALGAIKPQTNDVSVSTFNHISGQWNTTWATYQTEIPTGEHFAAWNFGENPIVFTTYGDLYNYETESVGEYDYQTPPAYTLYNDSTLTITHTDNNTTDNENWLAVSNPYTHKLKVSEIINQNTLQGNGLYKYNGITFALITEGDIQVTEGFFVNTTTLTLNKNQRITTSAKTNKQKDYIRLLMQDGENEIELLFAQNDKANAKYDIFDANKLFSPLEITEPYFVTDGVALVKEEVNALPYTANLNIRNYQTKEVTISIDNIPEGVTVFLRDNGQDIKMNGGVEYTTNITAGENADRFQLLVKKQQKIERNTNNQITIKNNNRQITITSDITNLNIEVYNNLGQKVFATKDYNFTLDQLPSGSYVVKAFYGRVNQSQKIVIE